MSTPFDGATCTAPAARAERMRDIVVEHAPRDRPIRVLDVGCGVGVLSSLLADALPLAVVIGVDLSGANVRAAAARATRASFVQSDYLTYDAGSVDVIVSDTALHFIADRERLWRKLSRDLRPGGVLVCAMAYACAHNYALGAGRRVLRAVRSPVVDGLLLWMARRTYGRQMNDALLRERTEYMYIPAEQMMTGRMKRIGAPALGLRLVAEMDMTGTSRTQLAQRVTIFQKD
jgi:ubiquinone/menaquinone biosynthesis C-methylase UbiE